MNADVTLAINQWGAQLSTQLECKEAGVPYILENVRAAQKFLGRSVNSCGPFHFWGNGVPACFPPETFKIKKGMKMTKEAIKLTGSAGSKLRQSLTATWAMIPESISEYIGRLYARN